MQEQKQENFNKQHNHDGVNSQRVKNKDISWGQVELPLDATGGFLVIPFCSGTPTGVPKTKISVVYDVSNNKLYIYNGTAWKSATFA